MTDQAWMTKRFFPFGVGREQLDGDSEERGKISFGRPPAGLCAPHTGDPPVGNRNTGWSPIIKSLAYVSLQDSTAPVSPTPAPGAVHDLTMQFVGNVVLEKSLQGSTGGIARNQRWEQVIFDETGIRVAYLVNIPVPVDDETGSPFGLRLVTQNRTGPSMCVLEYQWGRFVRDTSNEGQRRNAAELVHELVGRLAQVGESFLERLRGGGGG